LPVSAYFFVFTWGWDRHPTLPPGSTTVEISLVADGAGTILRLRHSGFPSEADRRQHADGWKIYLGNLSQRWSGQLEPPASLTRGGSRQ